MVLACSASSCETREYCLKQFDEETDEILHNVGEMLALSGISAVFFPLNCCTSLINPAPGLYRPGFTKKASWAENIKTSSCGRRSLQWDASFLDEVIFIATGECSVLYGARELLELSDKFKGEGVDALLPFLTSINSFSI